MERSYYIYAGGSDQMTSLERSFWRSLKDAILLKREIGFLGLAEMPSGRPVILQGSIRNHVLNNRSIKIKF